MFIIHLHKFKTLMKNILFYHFIFTNKIQINFNILTNIINKFIINFQF